MKSKNLMEIVKKASILMDIPYEKIQERKEWKEEKKRFIDDITYVMLSLKYFGFTENEAYSFIRGSEKTLDSVLFFFILKKCREKTKTFSELKVAVTAEWYSDTVWKNLNEISSIILDAFFEKKGGICFTATAKNKE